MKHSTTGVILSGLVYPGVGQIFLGRKYMGVGFIVPATLALGVIVYRIIKRVYLMMDQIMESAGNQVWDLHQLIEIFFQKSGSSWHLEITSLTLLVLCWVASILHAYRVGRRLDGLA